MSSVNSRFIVSLHFSIVLSIACLILLFSSQQSQVLVAAAAAAGNGKKATTAAFVVPNNNHQALFVLTPKPEQSTVVERRNYVFVVNAFAANDNIFKTTDVDTSTSYTYTKRRHGNFVIRFFSSLFLRLRNGDTSSNNVDNKDDIFSGNSISSICSNTNSKSEVNSNNKDFFSTDIQAGVDDTVIAGSAVASVIGTTIVFGMPYLILNVLVMAPAAAYLSITKSVAGDVTRSIGHFVWNSALKEIVGDWKHQKQTNHCHGQNKKQYIDNDTNAIPKTQQCQQSLYIAQPMKQKVLYSKQINSQKKSYHANTKAAVSTTKRTLYDILGASPKDTRDDIKRKYIQLAKECHPDALIAATQQQQQQQLKNDDIPTKSDFCEIAAAWRTLSDVKLRKKYDRSLLADKILQMFG